MFYKYEIRYFEEIQNEFLEKKGIVAGACYGDALKSLMQYYGDRNTEFFSLSIITDNEVLEIDSELSFLNVD